VVAHGVDQQETGHSWLSRKISRNRIAQTVCR
jgi:hypothetical protein